MPRKASIVQVGQVDARIDKRIAEVFVLDPSRWGNAAQNLSKMVVKQRKGVGKFVEKMANAVDKKVEEADRIAEIIKREPCLDPDEHGKVFMVFKTRRIARLFEKKVRNSCIGFEAIQREGAN
jgi:hypothetical protein